MKQNIFSKYAAYLLIALPLGGVGGGLLTSCADEFNQNYSADKPARLAEYAYLDEYQPLKNYVDRSKYPNFKLGIGTTANEYVKQELVYALTNSNFDEAVPGNAMKMASCVNEKGEMNFATVSEYVKAATDAGLQVYGHTLAWHAQQPVKWLNSLLADRPVPVDPDGMNDVVDYNQDMREFSSFPYYVMGYTPEFSPEEGLISEFPGGWYQYFAATGIPTDPTKGYTYKLTCEIKSNMGGSIPVQMRWSWGEDPAVSSLVINEGDWEEVSCEFTGINGTSCDIIFQPGMFEGRFCIRNIKVSHSEAAGPVTFMESLIDNGDMEGDDAKNFASKENAGATVYEITDGVGRDGSRGVKIASKGGQADAWESQFWIVFNDVVQAGDKIHVSFDYRADGGCVGTGVDTQAHFNPGEYQHWSCAGTVQFTGDWQTYDKNVTIDTSMAPEGKGMKSIAFNMSPNATDGTYYIDNVVCEIERTSASGGIPLTPEEKRDTLTWAMDKWIEGMMEACRDESGQGLVHAWDVVNEAISGGNPDGEGVYALQHGTPDNVNDFFWQDYLGDIDYVRTAVALARMYGPDDIKLFVNDYNLESDWDQNGKLKSLIKWIERWEADGRTKIDGIGSQMHISCYGNPATQESKKKAIENSFRLMAASGKLVRISELDMGYVDQYGNKVITADMTEEQHKEMAELYKWIVAKYLEIIPVAQQWGICQWCATDAPANSGWRGGEPVGLWDLDYYRKHTYAGFADGLAGK